MGRGATEAASTWRTAICGAMGLKSNTHIIKARLLTACDKDCNKTCTYNQERLGTIKAAYQSRVYGVTFMGNRTEY